MQRGIYDLLYSLVGNISNRFTIIYNILALYIGLHFRIITPNTFCSSLGLKIIYNVLNTLTRGSKMNELYFWLLLIGVPFAVVLLCTGLIGLGRVIYG